MNNACSIKGEKQTCPLPFERGQAHRMKHKWGLYTSSLCPYTTFPSIDSWLKGKFRDCTMQWVSSGRLFILVPFCLIGQHNCFVCVYVTTVWSSDISANACQRSGCPNHRPLNRNFTQRQTSNVGGLDHTCNLHFSHMSYTSWRNRICNSSLYIRFLSMDDSQQILAISPWTESALKAFRQSSTK